MKKFEHILKLMKLKNASDIFVSVGIPIMMKIDGKLEKVDLTPSPLSSKEVTDCIESTMDSEQKAEFEHSRECNYAISLPGVGRFRASAFFQRDNPAMVVRKIETIIPTMDDLNLPAKTLQKLALTKRGLIIFVGGTGTGKSTSLASLIDYRNRNTTGHIITIEDPIEYVHEHKNCIISQREVGSDTESFEVALKNTLRQAPDVILIGEIRTRETMEHAIAFAETGHLCLATLHANNANQALDRIINFFPPDRHNQIWMDLSLNLRATVAQQLIPMLKQGTSKDGEKEKKETGRIAAVEIMINSPLIQDYINKGQVHHIKGIMEKSEQLGMQTFDAALVELYRTGKISEKNALKHADSENNVRLKIKGLKVDTKALSEDVGGFKLEANRKSEDEELGIFTRPRGPGRRR